jgi:hypothetical protein
VLVVQATLVPLEIKATLGILALAVQAVREEMAI